MENNKRIKVLFANVPADGHFNPLTGLAVHLKNIGFDVRWYCSTEYAAKIKSLDIPFYPFKRAMELTLETLDHHFPERKNIKNTIRKLNFDMQNFFILRSTEYYADIKEIHETFPFDVMIADVTFTGIPFVKDIMKIPVLTVGVLPLVETSKDLAPSGLGMTPATNFFGRRKQDFLRFLADKILFGKTNKLMRSILAQHEIYTNLNVFDLISEKSTLLLQSGSPGFEYKRSDMSKNIRFIGALLPHGKKRQQTPWYDKRVAQYRKVVLVTQGTAEKDVSKLLTPTLEAFQNSDYLVIATTGGSGTQELRTKFPQHNFIIEDFIPFNEVMPYCHAYVTNGGYGGVMLGINNNLPMVVAGVHEGKNEINARIGYFGLGIDLRTELPKPAQLKAGVEAVIADKSFRKNVVKLKEELASYNPHLLIEKYVYEVTGRKPVAKQVMAEAMC